MDHSMVGHPVDHLPVGRHLPIRGVERVISAGDRDRLLPGAGPEFHPEFRPRLPHHTLPTQIVDLQDQIRIVMVRTFLEHQW